MKLLDVIRFRIRALVAKNEVEAELDDELRFHIERETQENVKRGMTAAEARRVAMAQFGGIERFKEELRDQRSIRWIEEISADARHGFRLLRKNALFSAAVIGTLALGIGATSTIFTIVNAVLLRPVAYTNADRVVSVSQTMRGHDATVVDMNNYAAWNQPGSKLGVSALYSDESGVLKTADKSVRVRGGTVTQSFTVVLGVKPKLGRWFDSNAERVGANPVIVLGDALWRTKFNGDTGIINRTITLDDKPRVVIGVMPAGLDLPTDAQFWIPLTPVLPRPHEEFYYSCIARLRDGVSLEAAQLELQMLMTRLDESRDAAEFRNGRVVVMSLHDRQYGSAKRPLMLLLGTVAVLLLIACANIANLTLAHSASRRREFAVRLALGASRWRLMQQLLIENAILATIGGAIGALIPFATVDALVKYGPSNIAGVREVHVNATVMIFAAVITIFVAVVCGLTPALAGARSGTAAVLKAGSLRVSYSRVSNLYRSTLVTLEVAAALTLLTGAGLLTRSFARAIAVDPGFRAENVIATYFFVPNSSYVEYLHKVSFFERVTARIRELPGMESVALSRSIPLYPVSSTQLIKSSANDAGVLASTSYVDGEYANTFGLHLISGRFIDSTDRVGSRPAVMISEAAARVIFPGINPVGRALPFPARKLDKISPIVVGVVRDVTQDAIEKKPMPQVFYSMTQQLELPFWLSVRTSMSAIDYERTITKIVSEIDSKQEAPDFVNMSSALDKQYAPRRFNSMLINAFSALALVLAMIGLYGIVAYGVVSRTQEIGIRMALGAQHANVVGLVLRQGLALASIGVVIGVATSYALARALSSLLFEVQVHDAVTFIFAPLLLLAVATIACAVPARRASRVSPTLTLRAD